jgi:hypothetical protein
MQEKKNIRLLVSLVVLIGLCVVFIFFGSSKNTVDVDKELFRVEDQTQVNKVVMESKQGNIELKFDGSKWLINNSFEADRQMVKVFFATILQAEPKRLMAEGIQDSVSNFLVNNGIHVTLFEDETLVKDFWVSGNERKTETYFQLAQTKIPYLITIPGYRVYVASIFELTASEWRDKRIFNFNWQNFKSLKAHFPQQANQDDFTVSFANQLFGINEVAVADTTKLSNYLESVFNLQADQFPTNIPGKYDSLLKTVPVYSIKIMDIANRAYQLEVFPPLKGEQVILGRVNADLPAYFNPKQIAQIVRKRSYFEY